MNFFLVSSDYFTFAFAGCGYTFTNQCSPSQRNRFCFRFRSNGCKSIKKATSLSLSLMWVYLTVHLHWTIAKAKAKVFFDVCRLNFDHFWWLFEIFRFRFFFAFSVNRPSKVKENRTYSDSFADTKASHQPLLYNIRNSAYKRRKSCHKIDPVLDCRSLPFLYNVWLH